MQAGKRSVGVSQGSGSVRVVLRGSRLFAMGGDEGG